MTLRDRIKLFIFRQTPDGRMEDLGYAKVEETCTSASYERAHVEHRYVERIDLQPFHNAGPRIQCYVKDSYKLNPDGFSLMCALDANVACICLDKMIEMGAKFF